MARRARASTSKRRRSLAPGALVVAALSFGAVVLGLVTGWWRLAARNDGHLAVIVPERDGWRTVASVPGFGTIAEALSNTLAWTALAIVSVALLVKAVTNHSPHRTSALATALLAATVLSGPANATFTIITPPTKNLDITTETTAAPTALSCTWSAATSVKLNWTASTSAWAAGYKVARSVDGGAFTDPYATVAGVATATTTDASASTPTTSTYTYKVKTYKDSWLSPFTSTVASTGCINTISTPVVTTSATIPKLNAPNQIAFDSLGNLAIADTANDCIRMVARVTGTYLNVAMTAGNLYTVAGLCGTGATPGTGDGGAATSARLQNPVAVAFDSSGNLYVTDTFNSRVRKVSTAGTITAFAGTGTVSDTGDGGLATAATLNSPTGVVVDSNNNVYISDSAAGVCKIRWVLAADAKIRAVAGTGTCGDNGVGGAGGAASQRLNGPRGLDMGGADAVYFADTLNNKVRKLTCAANCNSATATFTLSELAGTGTGSFSGDTGAAGSATMLWPFTVHVDASENVYIADALNHRIRKITASGGTVTTSSIIDTIAGNGGSNCPGDGYPALSSSVWNPQGVAVYSGVVYFGDATQNQVRRISADSPPLLFAYAGDSRACAAGTTGDGAPATYPQMVSPSGMAVDGSGNVYIADAGDQRIRKWIAATGSLATIAGSGTLGSSGDGGAALVARLSGPTGVALDASGNVFITDTDNHTVRKLTVATGVIDRVAGTIGSSGNTGDGAAATSATFNLPRDVVVDGSNNIYVSDGTNNRIRKFTVGGNISNYAGSSAGTAGSADHASTATSATFSGPRGLSIDGSGNIYVADTGNHKVRRIAASGGAVATIAGSTQGFADNATGTSAKFDGLRDVWVDGTTVYVADTGNHRIRKIVYSGANAVTTVAGTGTASDTGDNGPAISATINSPWGVTSVAGGNLYVAGTAGANVRKVIGPV